MNLKSIASKYWVAATVPSTRFHSGGVAQLELLDAAEELAAAKSNPEGAWLSPAAQALYEAEGAARFARCHPARRLPIGGAR